MNSRISNNSVVVIVLSLLVLAPLAVLAQDKIPKFLLIKLTRDQTSAMCGSEVFTQCMGFSADKCNSLAEIAIEQCLAPLPDEIDPKTLENSTLEQCPQEIYKKEGLSEEKAKDCFSKAMKAAGG